MNDTKAVLAELRGQWQEARRNGENLTFQEYLLVAILLQLSEYNNFVPVEGENG